MNAAGLLLVALLHCLLFNVAVALTPSSSKPSVDHPSRRNVIAGSILISTFYPHSAIADVYPGSVGGGASLIRPYYEEGSFEPSSSRPLSTKLAKERIQATQLSPLNQIVLPFTEQETYYPSFLFGSWSVSATLKSKKYPFGTEVVPSNSLLDGSPRNRNEKVGDTTSYEVHYFSTQTNAGASSTNPQIMTVNLGSKSKSVIADRAYNAISLSKAYKQLAPVQEVVWDYRKDPTQLTLRFGAGALAEDMRPLGQRRGEIFLTARASEDGGVEDGTFCAAERSRSVTLAPGNVIVSDSEVITEFRKVDDNHVTAVSRIAVYLTPNPNSREGILWQQVGGKAVAFFDYELDMTRLKEIFIEADGTTVERVCEKTPNGVVQCE